MVPNVKNFTLGFCPKFFLGVNIHMGKSGKILGQKVDVKFFRVDPHTLGNRIPRAFQNLSDLHVRCHGEKIYIGFLSQNFLGVTIHVRESGKKLGQKVLEKFFMVDPGKEKSKKVKKNIISCETLF